MSDGLLSENIDVDAEKSVISGLLGKDGQEVWLEISDIITPNTFVADSHQVIYKCIDHLFKSTPELKQPNFPLILSASKTIGYNAFLDKKEEKKIYKELEKETVDKSTVRPLAVKLRKLEVARLIRSQLKIADSKYSRLTGEEKLADILNIIEKPILDLSQLLHGCDTTGPKPLFENVHEYIDKILANPNKVIGLSTGWPAVDIAIGGGIRPGTVGIIASRFGEGKTSAGENIAYNVASSGVPCLLLDTEMSEEERLPRDLAMVSGVTITEIETGSYANNSEKVKKVRAAADQLKKLSYDYKNICGMEFDQVVAILKHWVLTKVGLNNDGVAKPCLIILDYLKLQSDQGITKNIAEYMLLGLLTTALVNFCQKYKVPGLSFAQVNRTGLQSEESDIIAGSDRILWFSSFCLFMKNQSEEEIQAQKESKINPIYDKKFIALKTRHGPGLDRSNYINLRFDKYRCKMTCGPTFFDLGKISEEVGQSGMIVDRNGPQF